MKLGSPGPQPFRQISPVAIKNSGTTEPRLMESIDTKKIEIWDIELSSTNQQMLSVLNCLMSERKADKVRQLT